MAKTYKKKENALREAERLFGDYNAGAFMRPDKTWVPYLKGKRKSMFGR